MNNEPVTELACPDWSSTFKADMEIEEFWCVIPEYMSIPCVSRTVAIFGGAWLCETVSGDKYRLVEDAAALSDEEVDRKS